IKPLEDRLFGRARHRTIRLITNEKLAVTDLEPLLRRHGLDLVGLLVGSGERPGEQQLDITCEGVTEAKLPAVIDALKGVGGVRVWTSERLEQSVARKPGGSGKRRVRAIDGEVCPSGRFPADSRTGSRAFPGNRRSRRFSVSSISPNVSDPDDPPLAIDFKE